MKQIMKLTKTWFGVPLACLVLAACLASCQNELSDEAIHKTPESMADALMEHPTYLEYPENGQWVESIVNALMEHPTYLEYLEDYEWVQSIVDALREHPKYLEYLEDNGQWAKSIVDALMKHQKYLEYLEDDGRVVAFEDILMSGLAEFPIEHPPSQTTLEEDCAIVIVLAAVVSGNYTLLPDSDVDTLCAWYQRQLE